MHWGFAALCGLAVASGVAAEEAPAPQPFATFEAKRVRPPAPGTLKRITVQIDPDAVVFAAPVPRTEREDDPAPGGSAPTGAAARYSWFWEAVGSDLDGASPGRLVEGLAVLERRGEVPAPRLQDLQAMIGQYGVALLTSTIGTEVSPALVLAVMAVESGGKADAVSRVGATGLMQLMPGTAQQFGVEDSLDPVQNIEGGVRFLNWLMQEFSGDPLLVLAGYNAGPGAVRDNKGVPPFAETRDYVPKVLAAYQIARNLCATPPVMISDGCVFQTMK